MHANTKKPTHVHRKRKHTLTHGCKQHACEYTHTRARAQTHANIEEEATWSVHVVVFYSSCHRVDIMCSGLVHTASKPTSLYKPRKQRGTKTGEGSQLRGRGEHSTGLALACALPLPLDCSPVVPNTGMLRYLERERVGLPRMVVYL